MDAIEVFLMFLVGLSVLASLIDSRRHSIEKSNKDCRDSKPIIDNEAAVDAQTGEIPKKIEIGDSGLNPNFREEIVDDWEGIERTELERAFGKAVVFVSKEIADSNLELYGLQKVALEGPCYESQPLPFNISARSKWNAWNKLGNMSRETAMEQYIDILSNTIPHWKGEDKSSSQDATCEDVPSTQQKQCEDEVER